jgi:hypothetical protein
MVDGRVRAVSKVNGSDAYIHKIFVSNVSSWRGPKVDHIMLYGNDVASGAAVEEKITPWRRRVGMR